MFSQSQLVEISQRFQMDVEDLQVLLQGEGLSVGSADCLEELSNRLDSDLRFRRDVAFMVRSMMAHERSEGEEPGSMDVLGVLIVAAAGPGHGIETASRQQTMRKLLRFVMQQRIPAAATRGTKTAATGPIAPTPSMASADLDIPGHPPASVLPRVAPAPEPLALLPHAGAEPAKHAHTGWGIALLAILMMLGTGVGIWYRGTHASVRPTQLAAMHPRSSAQYATPELHAAMPAIPPRPNSGQHKLTPPVTHRAHRLVKPGQASHSIPLPASVAPYPMERPEPAENAAKPNQQMSSNAIPPLRAHPESPAVSLPAKPSVRQPSAPGVAEVNKVFAHPEVAAAAADIQAAPPVFHRHEPVLIARNSPDGAAVKPQAQGTVHLGSTGTMASNLLYSPEPEYPPQAIAAGLQGEVMVRAVVGPQGNVIDAQVVSGPPLLREAALDAVGRWRYRPYEEDGKPVTIATTAILDFQIPSRK